MRKLWVVVWVWILAGCAGAAPLLYGPWTGAPTATTITISWAWATPAPVTVRFGPLAEYFASEQLNWTLSYEPSPEEKIAHVTLEGLEPGTWYAYRLCFADGACTAAGAFKTAPEPGEPVRFAVLGDTQWQWEGINRVELVAWSMVCDPWPFHFVLHAGDLVETPIPSHWRFFFSSMAPILRWAPLVPVLGNHERDSLTYYQHFTLPPGGGRMDKRWWVLRYGDVVVVGLDSNLRKLQDYNDQLEWLRANLSGPEPHKIVIFHHPVFSSDASYGPGTEGLQKVWHPLFVELGVDLVFSGHAHNYERIERDGVTYVVVGLGGANLYALARPRVEGSIVGVEGWYGYAAVEATAEEIHVRVMGVAQLRAGQLLPQVRVLDEFSLPKK